MVAYQFYWLDREEEFDPIGILPERRIETPERITEASILNWGRTILSGTMDPNDLFFVQITIDEETGAVYYPKPFLKIKAEA